MAEVKFVRLTLGLVEEGRFAEKIDADLVKAQSELVRYVREHGAEAEKAKVVFTAKIELVCVNPNDFAFAVITGTKIKLCGRPAGVSSAVAKKTGADESLFVRRSGSSTVPPEQKISSTEDGRRVDEKTGEILDE